MDRFGLVGTVLEGRYHVNAVVAEGGFGVVYRGTHIELDTAVALKVLKSPTNLGPDAAREFVQKFRQEAKTMARFRHPNIVLVQDTGVSEMPTGGQAAWMVLEWLEGETLQSLFARQAALRPTEVLTLLRPVLDALAYAHDEGVAHRDVKPENIFLTNGKRGRLVKLLDFGIAKIVSPDELTAGSGETHTQSSFSAFSPSYAAPEQITRARTGPWTDVHAMGLIFTQALIGRRPYEASDITSLCQEVLSPTRATPARFGLDVGAWEGVLGKALAFRPDQRYPNAGAFLADLDSLVHGITLQWENVSAVAGTPNTVASTTATGTPRSVSSSTSRTGNTFAAVTGNSNPASWSPTGNKRAWVMVGLVGLGMAALVGLGIRLGRSNATPVVTPSVASNVQPTVQSFGVPAKTIVPIVPVQPVIVPVPTASRPRAVVDTAVVQVPSVDAAVPASTTVALEAHPRTVQTGHRVVRPGITSTATTRSATSTTRVTSETHTVSRGINGASNL